MNIIPNLIKLISNNILISTAVGLVLFVSLLDRSDPYDKQTITVYYHNKKYVLNSRENILYRHLHRDPVKNKNGVVEDLPAIIYAVWASSVKEYICPKCKNKTMIPINSDNGKKLAFEKDTAVFEKIIQKIL